MTKNKPGFVPLQPFCFLIVLEFLIFIYDFTCLVPLGAVKLHFFSFPQQGLLIPFLFCKTPLFH